ncbi:MAG TPA: prepilin-type N-terminal cleavage/methylation domain-containing protein [Phycisphaerae bacterium]|nr:prepilin-type N-terminal cleavage/methylation domain-containing protein [Phycisphaerae bacterium]HOB76106.1 prepilin-type N-terminal cleavage/methylation domain-containing protein [Phycisphaerae bacterium]HOJ56037.1 prepilin-type N-terminal cleavage/methylation domain-containing protein [Phycisphaerae bacterium]HOL27094.1 prepilin-type N-terminal cleavage/methylation domain-containing protein [Phycisphaerae bacterium]HPP21226.1 prepilin-type N-terminal cleavage/methylation domain-containing 
MRCRSARGFALIEVLVVVAVLALLVAILLPALSKARLRSRVVAVHSDLRQITLALDAYAMEHKDKLPATRQSCGTNILYQLPVELATGRYLPRSPDLLKRAFMEDPFCPGQSYRYRAPGPVWQNGILMDFPDVSWRPRANLWVPDDVPQCRSETGRYYANYAHEPKSPVTYAVWSMGPNMDSAPFPRWPDGTIDEARFPLPSQFWLTRNGRASGLITHFRTRAGLTFTSP